MSCVIEFALIYIGAGFPFLFSVAGSLFGADRVLKNVGSPPAHGKIRCVLTPSGRAVLFLFLFQQASLLMFLLIDLRYSCIVSVHLLCTICVLLNTGAGFMAFCAAFSARSEWNCVWLDVRPGMADSFGKIRVQMYIAVSILPHPRL